MRRRSSGAVPRERQRACEIEVMPRSPAKVLESMRAKRVVRYIVALDDSFEAVGEEGGGRCEDSPVQA